MRRGILVLSVLLAAVPLWPIPAEASGGGGCGKPVTEASGTNVAIRDYCFTPTISRVRPGEAVVWTNEDGVEHNVVGANAVWGGFETLAPDATATYRFSKPGVYPYVCTWHPGMVGAVVVGGGGIEGVKKLDAQAVAAVLSDPPSHPASRSAPVAVSGGQVTESPTRVWQAVAIVSIGLVVATALVVAVRASRRREERSYPRGG
jgi:plastocyanin